MSPSDRPGVLERIRRMDGAATLVRYISANVQNRRRRMRHYGPAAAESPLFYEVACLYFAVQVLILLAVRPDGCAPVPFPLPLDIALISHCAVFWLLMQPVSSAAESTALYAAAERRMHAAGML